VKAPAVLAVLIVAFALVPNEPIMRAPWEVQASDPRAVVSRWRAGSFAMPVGAERAPALMEPVRSASVAASFDAKEPRQMVSADNLNMILKILDVGGAVPGWSLKIVKETY
jgi:hypothetical protein